MSKARVHLNSLEWDRAHREKRIRKMEKILGLRALLEMWEPLANDNETNHIYVLELRAKLRSTENQFNAMKI